MAYLGTVPLLCFALNSSTSVGFNIISFVLLFVMAFDGLFMFWVEE